MGFSHFKQCSYSVYNFNTIGEQNRRPQRERVQQPRPALIVRRPKKKSSKKKKKPVVYEEDSSTDKEVK